MVSSSFKCEKHKNVKILETCKNAVDLFFQLSTNCIFVSCFNNLDQVEAAIFIVQVFWADQ